MDDDTPEYEPFDEYQNIWKLWATDRSEAKARVEQQTGKALALPADPTRDVRYRPKLAQIGDRPVYIGDLDAAQPAVYAADEPFSAVLSVDADGTPLSTHHYALIDGPGNDRATFAEAVETACELVEAPGDVLIHCAAGISRSSTVLATALAATEGRSFEAALRTVQRYHPPADPHPALREFARQYLEGTL